MHIMSVSRKRFVQTVLWAVFLCALIVSIAASLGRATMRLHGAFVNEPDLAIYLLLRDAGISESTFLREQEDARGLRRDYLVHTEDGSRLVILRRDLRADAQWYLTSEGEPLREESSHIASEETETIDE